VWTAAVLLVHLHAVSLCATGHGGPCLQQRGLWLTRAAKEPTARGAGSRKLQTGAGRLCAKERARLRLLGGCEEPAAALGLRSGLALGCRVPAVRCQYTATETEWGMHTISRRRPC
jgi:hypothetical protein